MPAALETILKAEGIAAAIQAATGNRPDIVYQDDTANLIFTETAAKNIRDFLEVQAAKEGKIKIAFAPVVVPLLIKKSWPIAAAVIVTLLLTGYIVGRNR